MEIKCFDATKSLIEELEEALKDGYKINKEAVREYEKFCSLIDALIKEWESEYLEVEIPMNGQVNVTIEAFQTEVDKESGVFPMVLSMCKNLLFTAADDQTCKTRVCFIFPSLVKKS